MSKYFDSKPTIDLISIGIVSSDGSEYYAISKDFNLKEAWNRVDEKECYGIGTCQKRDFHAFGGHNFYTELQYKKGMFIIIDFNVLD